MPRVQYGNRARGQVCIANRNSKIWACGAGLAPTIGKSVTNSYASYNRAPQFLTGTFVCTPFIKLSPAQVAMRSKGLH